MPRRVMHLWLAPSPPSRSALARPSKTHILSPCANRPRGHTPVASVRTCAWEHAVLSLTPSDPVRVGPFRLLGRLGADGMGLIYAGTDSTGRRAAIKVVQPQLAHDPAFRARFAREALLPRSTGAPQEGPRMPCVVCNARRGNDSSPWSGHGHASCNDFRPATADPEAAAALPRKAERFPTVAASNFDGRLSPVIRPCGTGQPAPDDTRRDNREGAGVQR